jgi:hypothetical protein
MPHLALACHPASLCPQISRFTAHLASQPAHRWRLQFRVEGAIEQLSIPDRTLPRRVDGLWQHTCFEAFARATAASDTYYEFNFSPSGEWAAYRFDRYRDGMTAVAMDAPYIAIRSSREQLDVEVEWTPPPELSKAQSGILASLTAVIEDRDARMSYWALRHAGNKPDFHQRDSFVLQLPASPAAV